jgi:hypothetical protein
MKKQTILRRIRLAVVAGSFALLLSRPGQCVYDLPNDNAGCPANCRQIPWQAGSDLWNGGTLPNYTSVTCTGLAGNGTTDDGPAIQTCINNASAGTAVYIPAGTYLVNSTVRLKSNVVLRGAGSTTQIDEGANGWLTTQDQSHSVNIDPPTTYNQIPTTYALSGAPQKGDTTLTIGSGQVSVGAWIKVFGNDDPTLISDPGGSCDYCGDDTGAYLMQQIVQVTTINSGTGGAGSVVTISQPLYYTPFTSPVTLSDPAGTEPAGAKYNIITFPTQKAGYEYFHVIATGDIGASQIMTMQGCLYCWVKGVETQYTGSNSNSAHIELTYSYGNEVRDCYVHEQRSGASGAGYGIWEEFTNGNHKIENNIARHNRHGIIWEGGGGGDVVLYNYIDDEYTDDLTYLGSARPNHGAHPYMNLWEGNITSHLSEDDFHGSASHFVFFRNNMWGDESNDNGGCSYVTPAPTCGNVPSFNPSGMEGFDAIDVYTLNTYMSFVANVLGRTGMHVNWPAATLRGFNEYGTASSPIVYSYAGAVGSVPSPDTTSINHGNYDFMTNGVAYWDGGSDHTFAPSWYYTAKPAFLKSKPWPLIGPDVAGGNLSGTSGLVNTNAAYDCYWTGGVHANQPFNPAACYGSGDTQAPTVPTNLTAVAVSSTQINLSWTASTDTGGSGVAGYGIWRTQGGTTVFVSSVTVGTSYPDQNLSASTLYSYAVTAYDATGNVSALSTPPASATTNAAACTPTSGHNYSTSFPLTENPISECGSWTNGGATGLDWHDCRTTTGFAFGTQPGTIDYDDSTCVLVGTWGPNQTAQATVHIAASDSTSYEEVEVRLHTTVTPHSITGYEINCSVKSGDPYLQIVRWNGPLANSGDTNDGYTQLNGASVDCADGDALKATIDSNGLITAYKNGTVVETATDTTYTGGSPGMGFYIQGGASSTNADFGFSQFSATDGSSGTTTTTTTTTTTSTTTTTVVGPASPYPLKVSANGRYLVDQNNAPFLLMGDSPQGMIATITPAQMATYMADRQAHGFNALAVDALVTTYTGGNANGTALDGTAPFTSGSSPSNYDLSTLNSAYFSELDSLINAAAADNLAVFLDPIETGGWLGTLENNGTTKAFNFGAYLGNRYKNFKNIVWYSGNDFQDWNSNNADNNLVYQVMSGIASADPNHLQTIELNYNFSYSNQDTTLAPVLTLDMAYTYGGTYDEVLQAYNSSPTLPDFMGEANYEYENDTGGLPGPAGAYVVREEEYWTMTSGGTGSFYGNHYTWGFISGWQNFLDSPGALEVQYLNQLFNSFSWWNLAPDQTHQIVTSGYGTYDAGSLNLTTNNYVTTAWITDGSLAIAYCPTTTTLTVNMAKMNGSTIARWYDPSNGTYTTISGSPFVNNGTHQFTTPDTNHDGNNDWVLVLEVSGTGTTTTTTTTTTTSTTTTTLPPGSLPVPDLSGLNGKTFALTDEISFSYPVSGVNFTWNFVSLTASARWLETGSDQTTIGAPLAGDAPSATTSAPRLTPASAGLTPGIYQLTVTVTESDQSQSATATITLVSADLNAVQVYPNPWRSDKHAGKPITFANLSTNTTVKIFTASGHLAKDLGTANGTVTWDLENESGDKVASGIYLYLITDGQGDKVRGKIGVIR